MSASVDSKALTLTLSPLDATLTKNMGVGLLWLTRNAAKSNLRMSPKSRMPDRPRLLPASHHQSLDVQRLQLRIHQERIVELRHLAPAFSENRQQPCRKRLVPLKRQAGHVSDNQRKLIRSDVAGHRNGVQSRAAHRRITQQRINGKVSFAPALG